MPRVSIVLPTSNGGRYLTQSIDSCLSQTHTDIEVLVVDGASTDDTPRILERYRDPRLRVIHQQDLAGRLPGALNEGFAVATGDYLSWTHDDNWYTPDAIAWMLAWMDDGADAGFVYTDYWRVGEGDAVIGRTAVGPPEKLDVDNCVGHCFLYRRTILDTVGPYAVEAFLAEDYEYWLRVRRRFRMRAFNIPLYYYREHGNSLTAEHGVEALIRVTERCREQWIGVDPYFYPSRYARTLAKKYIELGFDRHAAGDVRQARALFLRALRHNPRWLANRGVAVILMRAAVGRLQRIRAEGPG